MLKQSSITYTLILCLFALALVHNGLSAPLTIPGEEIIRGPSIPISSNPGDGIWVLQSVGFKILGFLKIFISGIALIYLVMIGAYMVVFSENEEKIKNQRKQITYALIAFLFLNIPGMIYSIFLPSEKNGSVLTPSTGWSNTSSGLVFWDTYGFDGIFGWIIAFFRVFIFGVAVLMFTWWLFRMIVSAGDDEAQKQWKNRLIYGTLGLIFLGFVEFWGALVAGGDFEDYIPYIGSKLFGIAIYFAAPIAIFFLMWWAYYYITSWGDEERIKKGKNILMNTFIASLILIASLSFLSDIINFQL
jgi:hypothetical protein